MNKLKLSTLAAGIAILGGAGFLLNGLPTVAQASDMTVYKSDSCGCCGGWVEHMRKAGYAIGVVPTDDLAPVKTRLGVPQSLWSCLTAVVDGKVIEGHVPAAAVNAFLVSPGASRGHRRGAECPPARPAWRPPATPPNAMTSCASARASPPPS